MLTESPRVIFSGQGPGPNCNRCMGEVQMVRGVGLRSVSGVLFFCGRARSQTAIGAWEKFRWYVGSGCRWLSGVLFLRQGPGPNCNWCMGKVEMVRGIALRKQLFFYAGRAGVTDPADQVGQEPERNRKGTPPQRCPNTIIIAHPVGCVNEQWRKVPESPFYTKESEVICALSHLVNCLRVW